MVVEHVSVIDRGCRETSAASSRSGPTNVLSRELLSGIVRIRLGTETGHYSLNAKTAQSVLEQGIVPAWLLRCYRIEVDCREQEVGRALSGAVASTLSGIITEGVAPLEAVDRRAGHELTFIGYVGIAISPCWKGFYARVEQRPDVRLGQGTVIDVVETDAGYAQDTVDVLLGAQTVPPRRVGIRRRNYVRRIRIYLPGLVTAADRRAAKPIGILIL